MTGNKITVGAGRMGHRNSEHGQSGQSWSGSGNVSWMGAGLDLGVK